MKLQVKPTIEKDFASIIDRNGDFIVVNKKDFPANKRPKQLLIESPNVINGKRVTLNARALYTGETEGIINVDQKLRVALGIKKNDVVEVKPFVQKKNFGFLQRFLYKILGAQVNLVRVKRASFNDMEINLCRLSKESMKSIGVNEDDHIIVEYLDKKIKIRALELTAEIEKEVSDRIKSGNQPDRNCGNLLNLDRSDDDKEIDLKPIHIDGAARNKLGIEECFPIRVYRSITNDINKNLNLISIQLILALIAVLVSFNLDIEYNYIILGAGIFLILLLNLGSLKIKL